MYFIIVWVILDDVSLQKSNDDILADAVFLNINM